MTKVVAKSSSYRIILNEEGNNKIYYIEAITSNHLGEDIGIPLDSSLNFNRSNFGVRSYDKIKLNISELLDFINCAKKEVLDTFSDEELSARDSREYLKEYKLKKQVEDSNESIPDSDIPF